MSSIEDVLVERGRRYGAFPEHARITQALKGVMQSTPNWARLAPDQKEALEMVVHKVGRILNGDPDYADSWTDIVGYAKLAEQRLVAAAALNRVSDDRSHEALSWDAEAWPTREGSASVEKVNVQYEGGGCYSADVVGWGSGRITFRAPHTGTIVMVTSMPGVHPYVEILCKPAITAIPGGYVAVLWPTGGVK